MNPPARQLSRYGWRPADPPRRPVLFINPRSGDGKAARAGLAERARDKGIEAVVLVPGQDLAALAREAVAGGVLRTDWPLATLGRAAQSLWNRITHGHRPPVTGLDQRLLAERDTIRAVLGKELATGGRADRRPPRLRLRLPAGRSARHRSQPAALPGAAGLRRRRHHCPIPAHPGRAGHRRGKPQRPADPGRRPRRLRSPGHPVLLAPPAGRAAGLPAVPPPLRAPGPPARHAGRGRLHRIARAYATSRRDSASVRLSARRVTDQNSSSTGATVTRSFTAWASCRSSVIKASA